MNPELKNTERRVTGFFLLMVGAGLMLDASWTVPAAMLAAAGAILFGLGQRSTGGHP